MAGKGHATSARSAPASTSPYLFSFSLAAYSPCFLCSSHTLQHSEEMLAHPFLLHHMFGMENCPKTLKMGTGRDSVAGVPVDKSFSAIATPL